MSEQKVGYAGTDNTTSTLQANVPGGHERSF